MKIYVLMDNQPRGPYSPEFVRQMLRRGRLLPTHLGVYDGSTDWKPLSEMIPSWGETPKHSKSGLIAAMTVGALVLLAGAGGFVWWHAHRGTSGKIVASPKAVASAKEKTTVSSSPGQGAAFAPASAGPTSSTVSSTENVRPTREALAGKQFRFSWKTENGHGTYRPLSFHADGMLGGGTGSPNETFWTIDEQGRLVFKHRDGRVSTIFTRAEQRNGRWFFSGPYQFSPGVEHSLTEAGPEAGGAPPGGAATQPDAATRLKELERLYQQGLIPKDIYELKRRQILDSI